MAAKRPVASKGGCEEKEAIRRVLETLGFNDDEAPMDTDGSEDLQMVARESSARDAAASSDSRSVLFIASPPPPPAALVEAAEAAAAAAASDQKGVHNCTDCGAPKKPERISYLERP